jgi:hypothetical protein
VPHRELRALAARLGFELRRAHLAVALPRQQEGLAAAGVRAARVALPAAILLLPYLLWNWIAFGHLVPISGVLKVGLGASTPWDPREAGRFGLAMVAAAMLAVPYWLRTERSAARGAMLALALGASVHGLYTALRLDNVWRWYFAGEVLVAALTLEVALLGVLARFGSSRARSAVLGLALIGLIIVATGKALRPGNPRKPWYPDAALYLNAHVPVGAGIATCCSPGGLGYYSDRPIFALDGLMGDFAWQTRAAEVGLYEALRERGVGFVLSLGPRSSELARRVAATRWLGHSGEGVAFAGTIHEDGTASADALGVWSPIANEHIGWLGTRADNLVGAVDGVRALGLWRLEPVHKPGAQHEPSSYRTRAHVPGQTFGGSS